MTHKNSPTLVTDGLLEQLEILLDELPDAMRLDEIQGFLCAVLSGPQAMAEEDWLPTVLGDDDAQQTDAGSEIGVALRRFAVALTDELATGEPLILLLYPGADDETGGNDYVPWCQAYLAGVDAADDDWFEFLGGDADVEDDDDEEILYVDERLFPLLMLTGEAEAAAVEHGDEWPQREELEQLRNECEEDLPQAVTDLYRFWLAKRGTPTLRREQPKVGRNDPCPCGSGKKFKHCCAAKA